ncbi:hypothetical protein LMA04_09575 [Pseudescherichia vulneris]|uniref:hypothetical protein n=1 Tax=Pseudescherichia vulneris TaxID=566 RepID=UPI00227B310E|nr:hypothetical protein [Pseudescherichia vulneris]WAH54238.1 hypothetical protein LMA04_09575 [Pseudescherichia vulneris]
MSPLNNEERQAGTLLLSQLKMFNEAVVVFEQQIDPAIWKGIDLCAAAFIKALGWGGETDYAESGTFWFAPKTWRVDEEYKYFYESFSTSNNEVDYELALLTGCGTRQGQFGFRFLPSKAIFGPDKKLKAIASNIDQAARIALSKFQDLGKGAFFLPVTLDLALMAECWQENGEFPPDHELFAPLRSALETLEKAVPIFDAIFAAANDNL